MSVIHFNTVMKNFYDPPFLEMLYVNVSDPVLVTSPDPGEIEYPSEIIEL